MFSSSPVYETHIPRQKTSARDEVLAYIVRFYAENNCAPSYRQIGRGVKRSVATIQYHVEVLMRLGILTHNVNRQVRLLQ